MASGCRYFGRGRHRERHHRRDRQDCGRGVEREALTRGQRREFQLGRSVFLEERLLSLLASCPLFSALPERVVRELAGVARRRRYEAGQALCRVGDPSDAKVVLCSGRVRASIRSRAGRDLVLHVAVPGEAPGYIDLIDESPRMVNAVAKDDVEVLALPARAVLLEHPRALMQLSAELAGVVRQLAEAASDLVFLDLPARLAKLLLARRAPDGRVELGLTQSDLTKSSAQPGWNGAAAPDDARASELPHRTRPLSRGET